MRIFQTGNHARASRTIRTALIVASLASWALVAPVAQADHREPDCFAGHDGLHFYFATLATLTITADLGNGPVTDTVEVRGPTEIVATRLSNTQLATEIVGMQLAGVSTTFGPIVLIESPTRASTGLVTTSGSPCFPASATFGVFIETLAPVPLHNEAPFQLQGNVDSIPHRADFSVGSVNEDDVALYDPTGVQRGSAGDVEHFVFDPIIVTPLQGGVGPGGGYIGNTYVPLDEGSLTPTLPDTTCASAVGVGPDDIPHAYYTANGVVTFTNDACPDHYSGELGFGVGGVWLFSREGSGLNGGDGVVACYGSTDPTAGPTTGHHGADTTIYVEDDVFGGAVAFTVTRDYNRSEVSPFLPASNNAGDFDCGDSLVEPCDPADGSGTDYTTAPGCNPLDDSQFVFPQPGLCDGLSSLGPFPPPADPTLIDLIINFLLGLLGLLGGGGSVTCEIPDPNAWTVPNGGTLADHAGADGAVVLFIQSNVRADAGHFGTGTTGAVWTQ